jgi:hypothetical protein
VTTSEEAFIGAIFFFFAGASCEKPDEVSRRSALRRRVRMDFIFIFLSGVFRAGR